jgi:thimet oligopeptidase
MNALKHLRVVLGSAAIFLGASQAMAIDDNSPVAPALRRADTTVQRIVDVPDDQRTYENTLGAIDDLIAQLELDTNMMMFLAYVSTDEEERNAGQQAEQDVSEWLIDLQQREDLYEAIRDYADTTPALDGEQARLLKHTLRDYRRAGMELSASQRAELAKIKKEITRLSIEFEKNIREDEQRVPLTREELPGLPEDYFQQFDQTNSHEGVYLVGLSYPEFLPVMDYCDDEDTRKKIWLAYKRRGGQKNVAVLEKIIELRAKAARILGYDHPADYEIEIKMAGNADNVMSFYEKLRPLVRKKALRDLDEFTEAKRSHTQDPEAVLQPWDSSFYKNRLMREKYAVDARQVQEYFPLENVIEGLFAITQSLYGLKYRDVTDQAESLAAKAPLWHDDVSLYEVSDTATGEVLGYFYLDLHPRANKYGHAAQWGLAQHKVWSDGQVTKPVAALVCNFTKPTAGKPALLTHDEVETFFHEFGHCLHTILSETDTYTFGGTGVERDFVEAPSQMFENWVWDADVLDTFAAHYETDEEFPDELLAGMMKARHLGSGMAAERQFYYGLFDMNCHLSPDGQVDTTELAIRLWDPNDDNVELYDPVPSTHFQSAFGHLTGYQAGYYGYQWSLVYACDMFDRFRELGMLSPEAGQYYRRMILSRGGTKDGMDLVVEYLGREPSMEPYLKHLGLETGE